MDKKIIENFNLTKWEENCKKYDRNHKGLGFDVNFRIVNGHIRLDFVNLEKKYYKFMKELILTNVQGAIIFMSHEYHPSYAYNDEDYQRLKEENNMSMIKDTELLLGYLLKKDFDSFVDLVNQKCSLIRAKYELESVNFQDEHWVLPNGEVWNGNEFEVNGKEIYTFNTPIFESIFANTKKDSKEIKVEVKKAVA